MSLFLEWETGTIVSGGLKTDEIDLDGDCDLVQILIPPITSGEISLQVSEESGGAFYQLGNGVATGTSAGNYGTTLKLGGYRYIKIVSSVVQTAGAIFKIRGIKL